MDARATTMTEHVCDCCGRVYPEPQLHAATAAPEMTVCDACRHHVQRESLDGSRGTASRLMRGVGDRIRGIVMESKLHETKLLGAVLRWMDRRSPW